MEVSWHSLSVTRGQKCILKNSSGALHGGRMVALMGASGSGKTTLLTCLRHDIQHDGQVRFNGEGFRQEMQQYIGYGIGAQEARSKVEEVLALMRLNKIVDSEVGA